MARFSNSVLQITLLAVLCALFSTAAAQTASGGSIISTATSNGTYSKPTQSASSTSTSTSTRTTASNSPAVTSSISGASAMGFSGAGNEVFALILAGLVGGAVFGL